jgi:hypothetical protein
MMVNTIGSPSMSSLSGLESAKRYVTSMKRSDSKILRILETQSCLGKKIYSFLGSMNILFVISLCLIRARPTLASELGLGRTSQLELQLHSLLSLILILLIQSPGTLLRSNWWIGCFVGTATSVSRPKKRSEARSWTKEEFASTPACVRAAPQTHCPATDSTATTQSRYPPKSSPTSSSYACRVYTSQKVE